MFSAFLLIGSVSVLIIIINKLSYLMTKTNYRNITTILDSF